MVSGAASAYHGSVKRPPAVAGLFYPGEASALRAQIDGFLASARERVSGGPPRALIGPHAGTIYSGPIAATGYAHLVGSPIRRVVLLGPSHRVSFRGIAAPSWDAFSTPLGDLAVDQAAIASLVKYCPNVQVLDEGHRREHSLELHLPFLQSVFNGLQLVPLVVGSASPEEVAAVVDRFWDDGDTLVAVSTDLSHYHSYAEAERLDEATSGAIERLAFEELNGERACGYQPLRGLLLSARRRGLSARTVDRRSSGDTAGSRAEVVGYGSYLVS